MPLSDVVDVLIIGSGASGGPFAWTLSKAKGVTIVCLEQGDWPGKAATAAATEAEAQRQRLATPPRREGVAQFAGGYPLDFSESYWQPILGHAVGGASVHYAAVWARLHPADFLSHSLYGVADDWPISYWDLAPYYDLNDRVVGIAGVPGNPAYPAKASDQYLLPPHTLNRGAEVAGEGFKKLGWQWWPVDSAILTTPHGDRLPCSCSGPRCDEGCERRAKNSADVVFWPEAIRNGVELRTRARVREITVDKQGLADGALYYDADGRLQHQKARLVVVACNGIGTPRLLLNSKSKYFPHGLANGNGIVGKNFMSHPQASAIGLFESAGPYKGPLGNNSLSSDEFYETDLRRGFAHGFWWLGGRSTEPVEAALGERPTSAATYVPISLRGGRSRSPVIDWGKAHHAAFQESFRHRISLGFLCDELPEEINRVELDPTLTDEVGIPAPKLIHRRGENSDKMIAFGLERTKDVLLAAGATKIVSTQIGGAAVGHYLGTARMGSDPKRSVVDKWGRAHEVSNLFIIDGSVFTTSGACVPTATIQAIAHRTADYIKSNTRQVLEKRSTRR